MITAMILINIAAIIITVVEIIAIIISMNLSMQPAPRSQGHARSRIGREPVANLRHRLVFV